MVLVLVRMHSADFTLMYKWKGTFLRIATLLTIKATAKNASEYGVRLNRLLHIHCIC